MGVISSGEGPMTTNEIIKTLIAHRDRLNIAIDALQGGAVTKRRGRRPVKSSAPAPVAKRRRRRRIFTKAQRWAIAARMRQYWAKRKKKAGKGNRKA